MTKEEVDNVILMFKKTREVLYYLMQLVEAVEKERIKPKCFEAKLEVGAPGGSIFIDIDWTKNQDIFKQTASDVQVLASMSIIIMCFEIYHKLIGNKDFEDKKDPDLWNARRIFKAIRDTFAHARGQSGNLAFGCWGSHEKNTTIFKCCGVELDFKKLKNKNMFKWGEIGGLVNFIKLLDYLRKDLECKSRKLHIKS